MGVALAEVRGVFPGRGKRPKLKKLSFRPLEGE